MCGIFGYVGARDRRAGARPARAQAARVSRLRLLGHRRAAGRPSCVEKRTGKIGQAETTLPAEQRSASGTPAGPPTAASPTRTPTRTSTARAAGDHPQRHRPEPPRAAPRARARAATPSLRDRHRGDGAPARRRGRAPRRRPDAASPGAHGGLPPARRASTRSPRWTSRPAASLAAKSGSPLTLGLGRRRRCCSPPTTRRCWSTPAG